MSGGENGNAQENELSPAQVRALSAAFHGFLITYGRGQDISGFGKSVSGSASEAYKGMVRAVSQFIGAGIVYGEFSGLAEAWSNVWGIVANREGIGRNIPAARTYAYDGNYGHIIFSGSGGINSSLVTLYTSPSDLAKTMLHEIFHGLYPGESRWEYIIDYRARRTLYLMGLNAGGCVARSGFPACTE